MRILADGKVGIGTSTPAHALDVAGGIRASGGLLSGSAAYTHDRISFAAGIFYVLNGSSVGVNLPNGATSWGAQSDRRLKRDILPLEDALNKMLQISGMTYNYNVDVPGTPRRVGVIAQDVQAVLPEVVDTDKNGYLAVRYTEMIPLIINAIKDFYAQFVDQKREIASLKEENEQLRLAQEKLAKKNAQQIRELNELKTRMERLEKKLSP